MLSKDKQKPGIGGRLCKKHNTEKYEKHRDRTSKEERKVKSMSNAWRTATGKQGSLSRNDARKIIANPPTCPYCELPIEWTELSIDHKTPISRGGSNDVSNLVWADLTCNLMKGNLLAEEFKELLDFLKGRPEMLKLLRTRLSISGFAFRFVSKKKKQRA